MHRYVVRLFGNGCKRQLPRPVVSKSKKHWTIPDVSMSTLDAGSGTGSGIHVVASLGTSVKTGIHVFKSI